MSISSQLLGNILQDFLYVVIERELKVDIESEIRFGSKYFIPDIVIPNIKNPEYIIHVTHSRTQGMTNRKFFRNLEEVFETSTIFPDAKNINFTFGPVDPITYHDLNIEAQNLLFDSSWYSAQYWSGDDIKDKYGKIIYDYIKDNVCILCKNIKLKEERRDIINKAISSINKNSDISLAYNFFVDDVKKIIQDNKTSKVKSLRILDSKLSNERQKNLPYRKKNPDFFISNIINWKRGVIKLLWLTDEERTHIKKSLISDKKINTLSEYELILTKHLIEDLQLASMKVKGDKIFFSLTDAEFISTINNIDMELLNEVEKRLLEERPTVNVLLSIIRNKNLLEISYDEIINYFTLNGYTSNSIESLIYKQFNDNNKIRIDSIDILLSIILISQNEMSVTIERNSGIHFQGIKDRHCSFNI